MESGTSFSYKAKDPMSDERTLHVTDQSAKGKESAPKEWLSRNALHYIVLFTYLALVATVMCFHEPWFDEAQAWLIARDCSWKELLTVRPHYEGHPPLWWTMLAIPAKLGVPYEIGLKTINLVCAGFMIWLLEFKTAIPEILKAILPFSYFLCYQYGVTSRPYALMIAAMVLVAITWKTRDENPLPVVLSMMLLCLASSYGIVVSGVFAAYWTILLCRNRSLFKNKQCFFGLLALLLFAVALLIDILPAQGVYHGAFDYPDKPVQPKWITLLYLWLLIPLRDTFHLISFGLVSTIRQRTVKRAPLRWNPIRHDVAVPNPRFQTTEQRITAADLIHRTQPCLPQSFFRPPFRHRARTLHILPCHRLCTAATQQGRLAPMVPPSS